MIRVTQTIRNGFCSEGEYSPNLPVNFVKLKHPQDLELFGGQFFASIQLYDEAKDKKELSGIVQVRYDGNRTLAYVFPKNSKGVAAAIIDLNTGESFTRESLMRLFGTAPIIDLN